MRERGGGGQITNEVQCALVAFIIVVFVVYLAVVVVWGCDYCCCNVKRSLRLKLIRI